MFVAQASFFKNSLHIWHQGTLELENHDSKFIVS